jgi:hypothetical protein
MTASLAAILLIAAQAAPVHAGDLIDFSLTNNNSIALEDNGDYTLAVLVTTGGSPISSGNVTAGEQAITITALDGVAESTPITAYLSLLASTAGHRPGLSPVTQELSGSFAITQNDDGTGINYLSGSITDWTLSGTGSTATVTAGSAGTSTLTSDVINANDLSTGVFPFVFNNVLSTVITTGLPL